MNDQRTPELRPFEDITPDASPLTWLGKTAPPRLPELLAQEAKRRALTTTGNVHQHVAYREPDAGREQWATTR